MFAILFQVIL